MLTAITIKITGIQDRFIEKILRLQRFLSDKITKGDMALDSIIISTPKEARSATHCFYDLTYMCISPCFIHKPNEMLLTQIKEELLDNIGKYQEARKTAVELGADGIEIFPKDIIRDLRDQVSKYLEAFKKDERACLFYRAIDDLLVNLSSSKT
jgi:hypothetical protein